MPMDICYYMRKNSDEVKRSKLTEASTCTHTYVYLHIYTHISVYLIIFICCIYWYLFGTFSAQKENSFFLHFVRRLFHCFCIFFPGISHTHMWMMLFQVSNRHRCSVTSQGADFDSTKMMHFLLLSDFLSLLPLQFTGKSQHSRKGDLKQI